MAFQIAYGTVERYIPEPNETEVTIPDGVQKIGSSAFQDCNQLKRVIIPEGVKSIGRSALVGCSNLEFISISFTVREMDLIALWCNNIKEIRIDESNPFFTNVGKSVYTINRKKLLYYIPSETGEEYHIPDGTAKIGMGALLSFFPLSNFSKVFVIPESVQEIESKAMSRLNVRFLSHEHPSLKFVLSEDWSGCELGLFRYMRSDRSLENFTKLLIPDYQFQVCTQLIDTDEYYLQYLKENAEEAIDFMIEYVQTESLAVLFRTGIINNSNVADVMNRIAETAKKYQLPEFEHNIQDIAKKYL